MQQGNDFQSTPPDTLIAFLRTSLPFKELDEALLIRLARECVIDFFPNETLIFQQGVTEVTHFYLIQKGGVKIYLKDEEGDVTLKDFRGEGEYFGALPLIQETRANLNVETVEDTFCFLFPKESFLTLLQTAPQVTRYFLRSMSEKLVNTAYAELRHHRIAPKTDSALYLFSIPAGDIVKGPPRTIPLDKSVQHAAQLMSNDRIGSLLVEDPAGEIIGIVTDRDLRTKVVAKGLDYTTPIKEIMTASVHSISSHAVCFDALCDMMSARIHHLLVKENTKVIGLISTHDIMVLQGTSPLSIFKEIQAQRDTKGLHALARKIPQVVRTLVEEGAKACNIARMITIMNDHILERLLELLIDEAGVPPVPFCWLFFGSEGRREQTFKTDQDNGILYASSTEPEIIETSRRYFHSLGQRAMLELQACGFPPCPGNIMASNPQWCQTEESWRGYFNQWIFKPDPQEVRNATIFFDFRAGYGNKALAQELRSYLADQAGSQELFLQHLARDCMQSRPPLSFFRNFIVEKDGQHRNRLDLKTRGLVPFVDFARVMALKYGIQETNTMDRLRLLTDGSHIPADLGRESEEAYEFILHLRLIHQMRRLENDRAPDNHIDPGDLSDLEKQTLKEAFDVVGRLLNFIRQEFHLEGR